MRFIIVALFMLTVVRSSAQPLISLGAKGGLNLAKLNFESSGGSSAGDFWARYHLGVFADFRFNKFSIQPEILYSRQGNKFSDPSLETRVNLEYVSVPVLFKWYLSKGFNLQGGPQMSIMARGALEVQSNGSTASVDLDDSYHKFDWAMCLGIGWEAPSGLVTNVRYNLPINNISKVDNVAIHNQVIQLSVGYKFFKLGKKG
jgi:hypothetical protein